MPLKLPTFSEITNRIRADIKAELPDSDPYKPASILNTKAVAYSGRIRELYDQLVILKNDSLATTASDEGLADIGEEYGLSLNAATQADGSVQFVGTVGIAIPSGTNIQSSSAETYNTQSGGTIAAQIVSISSLTRIGSTVTATTPTNHNLGSGMTVVISGANETDYNGSVVISAITLVNFQYEITGTPSSPATGTIIASYDGVLLSVLSDNTGQDTNVAGGATLTVSPPISGASSTVYTTFSGIDGGSDIETYEEFRVRLLDRIQNPITPYNKANIILTAKTISGVTRVWVYEPDDINTSVTPVSIAVVANGYALITLSADHDLYDGMEVIVAGANEANFNGTFRILVISSTALLYYSSGTTGAATGSITVSYSNVQLGQTRILFVRDNDVSIIPSSGEITNVKDAILEIKPANTCDNDVIVEAPVLNAVDFTFTALSPDTPEMRTSIEGNLTNLSLDSELGATTTEAQYQTAIQNSYDTASGQSLISFTLSTPSGDIINDYNEIFTIGIITWP